MQDGLTDEDRVSPLYCSRCREHTSRRELGDDRLCSQCREATEEAERQEQDELRRRAEEAAKNEANVLSAQPDPLRAKRAKLVLWVALAIVVLFTFFFLYPGVSRYQYTDMEHRVDRLTGQRQNWEDIRASVAKIMGVRDEELSARDYPPAHWHTSRDECPLCKQWSREVEESQNR